MSSNLLIERPWAILPSRVPAITTTWRELCAADAKRTVVALEQGGFAGFVGQAVTDHMYSTRWGSSSCSPPA
jgi:hypothetical protein